MNIEQASALTDEELRIKVAELGGLTVLKGTPLKAVPIGQAIWPHTIKDVPDYVNDLNAMHEAEKGLESDYYTECLRDATGTGQTSFVLESFDLFAFAHATAKQRAIAFVVAMTEGY